MNPILSVIICTHNPRIEYLNQVLDSLKFQTLPQSQWELILIDNQSATTLESEIDLSWHFASFQVRENQLGLTNARLRAFKEASTDIIVFVDDDNILDRNYLKNVLEIIKQFPTVAAFGGKSLPKFEVQPQPWFADINAPLGLRDLGNEVKIAYWNQKSDATPRRRQAFTPHSLVQGNAHQESDRYYPSFAPIGAGLVIHKQAAEIYAHKIANDKARLALGRSGTNLISGEDNDLVLTILGAGYGVGYFPQLQLTHIIPAKRLTKNYLARLNRASSRSWVQVLDVHGIRLWQKIPRWTVLLRQIKAFFRFQPWTSSAAYISWQGACGKLQGQADLI
jgi:glycosyltransferase involved in cell wall biosynthesis